MPHQLVSSQHMCFSEQETVTAEQLAYWYFRLNGCPTIVNLLIHRPWGGSNLTDIDVLAVRFPFREELVDSKKPIRDHHLLTGFGEKILIVLADITVGACKLNETWTKRDERRILRNILQDVGAFPRGQLDNVESQLYESRSFDDDRFAVHMLSIGRETSDDPALVGVIQILWDEVLGFIHERFRSHPLQKSDHSQWIKVDPTGARLYESAVTHFGNDSGAFVDHWKRKIGIY